ncbi:MAG: RDD family protein [Bacteroidales bacterium]|jgi:uncharacterized RDD family membrane protein YckC|nr:RDD family protein [Bacteroidales bacterium]
MSDDSITLRFKSNLKKRIFATLIDYAIFILLTFLYIMFCGEDNGKGGKSIHGLLALVVPVFYFLYFVIIEAIYGGTFGHQAFELKVLTLDRKEISFSQAFKRHLLDLIDFFFYGIPAIIAIKNSEKHQRIGDMLAKTVVVDTSDFEQYAEEQINLKTDEDKISR